MLRHLTRHFFAFVVATAGALSVLVSVGATCLWVRGYWVADVWDLIDARDGITEDHLKSWTLTSGRGVVILMYSHRHSSHPPHLHAHQRRPRRHRPADGP